MIVLICTLEPLRIDWLPQFVAHYRSIGVERFLLTLQLEPDAEPAEKDANRNRFREVLASLVIDEPHFLEHEFDDPSLIAHQRDLQTKYVSDTDWVIWCDSDEFQVYPEPLPKIVEQCDAHGIDYIRGLLIDRIAADYGLPPFRPEHSIWETFPLACNVTQALAQGTQRKVVLTRGGIKVKGGKHQAEGEASLRTITGWVQVHHFKWDVTVVDRLQYRVRPEWKMQYSWWTEFQRTLDYFADHDSRFDPGDLKPIVLHGTHFLQVTE